MDIAAFSRFPPPIQSQTPARSAHSSQAFSLGIDHQRLDVDVGAMHRSSCGKILMRVARISTTDL
jgi:hypothetical protein